MPAFVLVAGPVESSRSRADTEAAGRRPAPGRFVLAEYVEVSVDTPDLSRVKAEPGDFAGSATATKVALSWDNE